MMIESAAILLKLAQVILILLKCSDLRNQWVFLHPIINELAHTRQNLSPPLLPYTVGRSRVVYQLIRKGVTSGRLVAPFLFYARVYGQFPHPKKTKCCNDSTALLSKWVVLSLGQRIRGVITLSGTKNNK